MSDDEMYDEMDRAHTFLAPLKNPSTPASVRAEQIEKFQKDCLARGLSEKKTGEIFSAWYECHVSLRLQVYNASFVNHAKNVNP